MEFIAHFLLFGGAEGHPRRFDAIFLMHAVGHSVTKWRASASLVVRGRDSGTDDPQLTEYLSEVHPDDVERVRGLMRQLGSSSSFEIAPAADTSLGWTRLSLAVLDEGRPWMVDLQMHLSGFAGPRAPLLADALREMIALSGAGPVWILDRLGSA